ncbi:hypothetical protein EDD86DRAFT_243893 [Gorgonomyces haynaldii]|nr:hypothetical protein EDD86DRAFT_243893 [Gorgonomyces haynaldii]
MTAIGETKEIYNLHNGQMLPYIALFFDVLCIISNLTNIFLLQLKSYSNQNATNILVSSIILVAYKTASVGSNYFETPSWVNLSEIALGFAGMTANLITHMEVSKIMVSLASSFHVSRIREHHILILQRVVMVLYFVLCAMCEIILSVYLGNYDFLHQPWVLFWYRTGALVYSGIVSILYIGFNVTQIYTTVKIMEVLALKHGRQSKVGKMLRKMFFYIVSYCLLVFCGYVIYVVGFMVHDQAQSNQLISIGTAFAMLTLNGHLLVSREIKRIFKAMLGHEKMKKPVSDAQSHFVTSPDTRDTQLQQTYKQV